MPHFISLHQALELLPTATRISVIGCSGGGKSTLSQKLSSRFNLEYVSIDRDVRWLPGWVVRDRNEQRRLLQEQVWRDRWIIDGTSASMFDIRLPRTDLVIWVRVPRRVALAGLAVRVFKHVGTTRPDMAEGCPEQLPDREFLSYIWNFEKKSTPAVLENLDLHGANVPVVVLMSRREIDLLT